MYFTEHLLPQKLETMQINVRPCLILHAVHCYKENHLH